jgi:hypothetical protein
LQLRLSPIYPGTANSGVFGGQAGKSASLDTKMFCGEYSPWSTRLLSAIFLENALSFYSMFNWHILIIGGVSWW